MNLCFLIFPFVFSLVSFLNTMNSKIEVYTYQVLKCLLAMQIVIFMYVYINLVYHQIKIYKQNGQKKWIKIWILSITSSDIYLFKVNNLKTRTTFSSELVIKKPAYTGWAKNPGNPGRPWYKNCFWEKPLENPGNVIDPWKILKSSRRLSILFGCLNWCTLLC